MSDPRANLEAALRASVRGQVRFDALTRGIYATDASHYQVMPACVVSPLDARDAVAAIRLAARHGLSITARGGGTSLSGQTTWDGMILDLSRHMHQVHEIDVAGRWARVGPGVVRDRLNRLLRPHGLHFAPDPATGDRATIGGMIGNNASGTRSIVYGKTVDHVLAVRLALSDGSVVDLGPTERGASRHAEGAVARIHRGVEGIVAAHRDEIAARFPRVMRCVSGYNLDAFADHGPWNLARLAVGSEGTLGVLLEARIRLAPLPAATALCIVHFDDLVRALEAVPAILGHHPSAVELLDDVILREAARNRSTAGMADLLEGRPAAVQIVEFFADRTEDACARAEALGADLRAARVGHAWPVRSDRAGQARVWAVRKLGLGLISNVKGPRKGQAFIEDACVPVETMPGYVRRVLAICGRHGVPVSLYGHASVGVLHIRPMLDLHLAEDVRKMTSIAEEAFKLVVDRGGAWSGEHGDGLVRSAFIPRFFGPRLAEAFRQVKHLFDPAGLMNPGKIVDAPPMTANLRYGPSYRLAEVPAFYGHRAQGGFALAVEQCNGVGACRKTDAGTMCPSYMATGDEEHSTRGRANALRLAMTGQLGADALAGEPVRRALELCLACKACLAECPNSVDMARLKGDVLQWHHDRHGTPLAARLVGWMPAAAGLLAGPLAPLANRLQGSRAARALLHRVAGVDRRRSLPALARRPLRSWPRRRRRGPDEAKRRRVVLFNDTYTRSFESEVGRSAAALLESCGYDVTLTTPGCCQRPSLSQGLLRQARRAGERTLRRLLAVAAPDVPVLVCEPSCASALADDLPDLIGDEDLAAAAARRILPIEVFLSEEAEAGRLTCALDADCERVLVHPHCHQRALWGADSVTSVLRRVPNLDVRMVDAGCCGMAGAFGYVHYDLSMKVGADRLFPAIEQRCPGTVVVASGTSCRHQIRDACGVEARHWVQVVRGKGRPPAEATLGT